MKRVKDEDKETPLKFCAYCDKKLERKRFSNGSLEYLIHFERRKYCNRECMANSYREKPKTDTPSWAVSHHRYRELKKADRCEICESTKNVDIHHIDGDWQNNSEQNLQALCRSCHMKAHRDKKLCIICGKPQNGLGYCNKHYIRFKKYGNPLFTKNKVSE